MIPDYKPTIPEWFHHHLQVGSFLSQTQAWLDAEQREAINRRYVVGTLFCWLAAILLLLVSVVRLPSTAKERSAPSAQSESLTPEGAEAAASAGSVFVEPASKMSPVLPEPAALARVLDELGAVEVQASFYTAQGENYVGPLWVRKVARGGRLYLDQAVLYSVAGPFRFRLPASSTVYIYAPVPGLDWNSGWGVPIKTPASIPCNQPCGCALRLEDLMIAARQK
jgi:hypothetical protein